MERVFMIPVCDKEDGETQERQTDAKQKSSVRYLHDCDIGYIIMDLLLHVDPYSPFIRAALFPE
jgi:hypothetical protein